MKKLILILLLVCLIPAVASAVILVRRSAVDVTAPEFSSAAIGTDGETVTINFNENVTGTENDTFTLDCEVAGDPIALTYSSGSGGTALVFTAGDVLTSTGDGESCTLDFDGDADDFEDDSGNDLADFDTEAVTNNSTQTAGCTTCSTGLVQAFIFDDGNADLDDWVGDNNVTLGSDTSAPAWGASNDGLIFDGSNDYATFTPLLTQWQAGATIAILITPAATGGEDYYFRQYTTGQSGHNVALMSASGSPYGMYAKWGQQNTSNTAQVTGSDVETKHWVFWDYDGSSTAELWNAKVSDGTDADITEVASSNFTHGFLGAYNATPGTYPAACTIYRVYLYSKELSSDERAAIVDDDWTPTKD